MAGEIVKKYCNYRCEMCGEVFKTKTSTIHNSLKSFSFLDSAILMGVTIEYELLLGMCRIHRP